MTIPDKCWLVTAGEYSDYRVIAVCATKDAAKRFVADEKARIISEKRDAWEATRVPLNEYLATHAKSPYASGSSWEWLWHKAQSQSLEEFALEYAGPWWVDEWDVTA